MILKTEILNPYEIDTLKGIFSFIELFFIDASVMTCVSVHQSELPRIIMYTYHYPTDPRSSDLLFPPPLTRWRYYQFAPDLLVKLPMSYMCN